MSWPVLILIGYGALSLTASTLVVAVAMILERRGRRHGRPMGLTDREDLR